MPSTNAYDHADVIFKRVWGIRVYDTARFEWLKPLEAPACRLRLTTTPEDVAALPHSAVAAAPHANSSFQEVAAAWRQPLVGSLLPRRVRCAECTLPTEQDHRRVRTLCRVDVLRTFFQGLEPRFVHAVDHAPKVVGCTPGMKCLHACVNASYFKGSVECARRSWLPAQREAPVVFVHVGKAGGGTVRSELLAGLGANSGVARGIFEVHMEPPPADLLMNATEIIFTCRDPVDRIVSAFNWQLPTGQRARELFGLERRLYRCFTHPEPFVRALTLGLSDPSSINVTCVQAAREAWDAHLLHIGQGLDYYYGAVQKYLPQLRYVLLETEALGEGLACLRQRLFPLPWSEQESIHQDYPAQDQKISAEAHAALGAVLPREYRLLNTLRKHAQPCSALFPSK